MVRENLKCFILIEEKIGKDDDQGVEMMSENEIIKEKEEDNIINNKQIIDELEKIKCLNNGFEHSILILEGENSSLKNLISSLQSENFELQSQLNEHHSELLSTKKSLITLNINLTQEYKESLLLLTKEKLDLETQFFDYKSQAQLIIKDMQERDLLLNEDLQATLIEKSLLSEGNSKREQEEEKEKGKKNSAVQPLNQQNTPTLKPESQELLLNDLGVTLDILAAKIDKLTEEKALLQLESSEKSEEILKLNKELIMLKIEKQDLADSLSGGCSQRTGQYLNSEIRELEERFKTYEQEIDALNSENKLMGMIVEEKSEKLENLTEKCGKLKEYISKGVKVLKETMSTSQTYERKMMVNSEIFEIFKSEQLNLVSRIEEVKKSLV